MDTIKVQISDNGELATVILGEELTIETCAEFKQALTDALDTARQVVLDARQLRQVDIASLQLICSACRSAASKGRSLCFENEIPDCMKSLRTTIGAYRGLPCNHTKSCMAGGMKNV